MNVLDRFRLDGRKALITGGSSGLGFEMARAFAEAGADLILVGRDELRLNVACSSLAYTGRKVVAVRGDVSRPTEAETLCDRVLQTHGPVDILVNNVGGRRDDLATEQMPLDRWQEFLDLNLTSALVCTKHFGAAMLERGWGRVINISSISGLVAFRGIRGRHYETAKAALLGLTRSVAADWAPRGVTVNAIAPGPFLTDPNRRWFNERPDFHDNVVSAIPMGRLGRPEEIGPLALFLASEASSYMTGAVLVLDGGYTCW